ncbi:hypothetical protein HK102_012078 [Quaeritorhiza haematococci]|nr:hypothetical protein HK102_012078 [Quaeritorhiza haematococci]
MPLGTRGEDSSSSWVRYVNHPKLTTHGLSSNTLFFADDGNIHASTAENAQILLNQVELKLGGEVLPQKERTDYLGVTMRPTGIDWDTHIQQRAANGRRCFVRPALEYGIALSPLSETTLRPLQRVQNMALRVLFGAWHTTSINGMHRLARVELFTHRNRELNARFLGVLHNWQDRRVPAVVMYHTVVGVRHRWENSPTNLAYKHNKIFTEKARRVQLLFNQLSRRNHVPPPAFTDVDIWEVRKEHMKELTGRVAEVIFTELPMNKRLFVMQPNTSNRNQLHLIKMWMLGIIATHRPCLNCGGDEELSRDHALECSGANTFIRTHLAEHVDPTASMRLVDQVIYHFGFRMHPTWILRIRPGRMGDHHHAHAASNQQHHQHSSRKAAHNLYHGEEGEDAATAKHPHPQHECARTGGHGGRGHRRELDKRRA